MNLVTSEPAVYGADEEVLNLTEELIPGQMHRNHSRLLEETGPENAMQARANPPPNSSTAAHDAEGSITKFDEKTNREIQMRIDETLAPLKDHSCDADEEF
jgi:hypothetical protein